MRARRAAERRALQLMALRPEVGTSNNGSPCNTEGAGVRAVARIHSGETVLVDRMGRWASGYLSRFDDVRVLLGSLATYFRRASIALVNALLQMQVGMEVFHKRSGVTHTASAPFRRCGTQLAARVAEGEAGQAEGTSQRLDGDAGVREWHPASGRHEDGACPNGSRTCAIRRRCSARCTACGSWWRR